MTNAEIATAIMNLDFDAKLKIAGLQILRFSAKKVYIWNAEGTDYSITDNDIAILVCQKENEKVNA